VKILFIRIDPVQEIAAERATLDLLRDILQPKDIEPRATPEFLSAARTCGWPLVYDDSIPPGYVYCRPTPGADPPMSTAEIEQYLQTLTSRGRSDG